MESEQQISRLIRESGVVIAPDGFTENVLDKIGTEVERKSYKPLIGRAGRLFITLFVIAVVAISIFYGKPGAAFPQLWLKMSELNFNLQFLSEVKFSTGLLSALVAILILVLFDAGLSRRRTI